MKVTLVSLFVIFVLATSTDLLDIFEFVQEWKLDLIVTKAFKIVKHFKTGIYQCMKKDINLLSNILDAISWEWSAKVTTKKVK